MFVVTGVTTLRRMMRARNQMASLRMLSLNRVVEWLNEMDVLRRAHVATF